MTRSNHTNLITSISGFMGLSTLAVLISLPALAEVNRPENQTDRRMVLELAQNAPVVDEETANSTLEREFIIMAAQGNNAEIQTSQVALQRSESDSVRQYAQRMIEEHTAANQQLEPLAAQQGIELPTTASSFDTAVLEKLTQVSDEQFDQAYMDTQVNAHLKSLAVFRTGARQVTDADLKNYAATLLPSIQEHLAIANEMARSNSAQLRY